MTGPNLPRLTALQESMPSLGACNLGKDVVAAVIDALVIQYVEDAVEGRRLRERTGEAPIRARGITAGGGYAQCWNGSCGRELEGVLVHGSGESSVPPSAVIRLPKTEFVRQDVDRCLSSVVYLERDGCPLQVAIAPANHYCRSGCCSCRLPAPGEVGSVSNNRTLLLSRM